MGGLPKGYKAVARDLKLIYKSATEEEGALALDQFAENWDDKYPQISKSWRSHWENINTLFGYPADIPRSSTQPTLLNLSTASFEKC